MTRPPRQSDILRAIKAAQDAGLAIARVEITSDGRIVLTFGQMKEAELYTREADRRRLSLTASSKLSRT